MFITYRNHHHMVKNMKCNSVINAINNNSITMFFRAHGFKKTCKRSLWFWLLLLLFYLTRSFLLPCYFSMPKAIHPGLSPWAPLALSSTLVISVCFFCEVFLLLVCPNLSRALWFWVGDIYSYEFFILHSFTTFWRLCDSDEHDPIKKFSSMSALIELSFPTSTWFWTTDVLVKNALV